MAWFDLNSLQQQISQSIGEASELISTVNRLEILNFDEMAVQQEEEEKIREKEEFSDDEEEVDEDDDLEEEDSKKIHPSSLSELQPKSYTTLSKPFIISPPTPSRLSVATPATLITPTRSLDTTDHSTTALPLLGEMQENPFEPLNKYHLQQQQQQQQEVAQKIQEELANEWNDSFLSEKPILSQNNEAINSGFDDTRSALSSIGESTTIEDLRSSEGLNNTATTEIVIKPASASTKVLPENKRPSIFGKVQTKNSVVVGIEPANLVPLAPTIEFIGENLEPSGKKKKKKKTEKSKKKKPKEKKKSLDFFGTSAFLKKEDDENDEDAGREGIQKSDGPSVWVSTNDSANVGGFGLNALWDDGAAAIDDYKVADDSHIPTHQSSKATNPSGDLESGNQMSAPSSGIEETAGSNTSGNAGSKEPQPTFLQNLSHKAVTSFFDNIETEIDLEEDPILKQVEWNKRNPHAMKKSVESNSTTFSYLSFFPTSLSSSSSTSASSASVGGPLLNSHNPSHNNDTSTSLPSHSSSTSLSSVSMIRTECFQNFQQKLEEIKVLLFPLPLLTFTKCVQIVWTILQCIIWLCYYLLMFVWVLLRNVFIAIFGEQYCSYSQEEIHSMRVRFRNRLREYLNANNILMGLTAALFIVSYWKFQRYGTDAGD